MSSCSVGRSGCCRPEGQLLAPPGSQCPGLRSQPVAQPSDTGGGCPAASLGFVPPGDHLGHPPGPLCGPYAAVGALAEPASPRPPIPWRLWAPDLISVPSQRVWAGSEASCSRWGLLRPGPHKPGEPLCLFRGGGRVRGASHTRSQDAVLRGGAHILTTLAAFSRHLGTSGRDP